MELMDQIKQFAEFIELHHHAELLEKARKGENFLVIDFNELSKFDPDLADLLLDQPEEVIKAAEVSIRDFDLPAEIKNFRIRFSNLPETQRIMIRDIRSKHLNKFLFTEGVVRQKSDVRPQVTSAKFECPSCGNMISVLQLDTKFREPTRCGCGRKGKFRLISKELVDAQRIVLEESPENLEGGEQPKRMDVFLKEDLVSPLSDKETNPGSKILVNGVLKEVPIILRTGGQSIRFDLFIEANYIGSVEEGFGDIEISEEEMEQIKELGSNEKVYEMVLNSIAPSIYGHSRIKEAVALQLIGGVRKVRDDGVITRGDMHILLIGDPGAGKSQILKRATIIAPKGRYVSGKGASGAGLCVSPNSLVMTNPGGIEVIKDIVDDKITNSKEFRPGIWKEDNISDIKIQSMSDDLKIQSKKPSSVWKLKSPEKVFEVRLSSGKKIELTGNTKLFTIENGKTCWKKSMDVYEGDYIATPRKLIGGNIEKQYAVDLIKSNPVLHNIKLFVKGVVERLSKKYGSIRNAAKILKIKEDKLYYNWTNRSARGNIKLKDLIKMCYEAGVEYRDKINVISLYNGKRHSIPHILTKDLLYVAGLIAGDGDIRDSGASISIRLSNSNEGMHKIFRRTVKKLFDLNYDIQEGNNERPTATRFHSKILAEILFSMGLCKSPKSDKLKMSGTLLHLSNNLLKEYIAGLYDSDGSIYIRKVKGSDCIDLTTCSETFARQLQLVLLRYEIHSRIRKRKPSIGKIKGKYDKWILEIRGIEEIKRFAKYIPLKHPDKKRKLKAITNKKIKANTNIDIIPGMRDKIKPLLQKNKIPLKKIGLHNNELSRKKLKDIIEKANIMGFEEIEKIAHSDIFWDKVIKVEEKNSSYKYVYDLTVEDSHNFVVDGVLVHNTAAVVRDEFLKGWALEAGALVLANGGFCMIDELDKMSKEDRSAMHEALEQQTVTISKANIQATLRAETTVLAAANPKLGRFDPYDVVAKQIDLPPTLINRFDLIFPIKDLPDKQNDEKMAKFILNLHQNVSSQDPDIKTKFLRKYIAYARTQIFPKLTDEAIEEIKNYYVTMRSSGSSEEAAVRTIPISARQLEALVRLSEANARIRLSDKVSKGDVKKAIDLLDYCLKQIGLDRETGKIDIDRITTGITATQRGAAIQIKEIISELENKIGKTIPIEDIVREAAEKGVNADKVDEAIERLKRSGDLFEPRRGFIQRI